MAYFPGVGYVGGADAERLAALNTNNYNAALGRQNNPTGVGGVDAERILQQAINQEIRALLTTPSPGGGLPAYTGGQYAENLAKTAYDNAVASGVATPNANGSVTGYQEFYGQPAPNAGGGNSSEPPWQVIGSGGVQSSGRGTPPNTPTFGSLLQPAAGGAGGPQNQGSGSLPGGGAALLFGAPNGNSSRVVR